ncbi:anthranilate synthase component I family protein [Bradyrhizobium sp. CB82]|uniref:anthranilate synthase component I family protein n=1 Tax=Bradyrhizobium sp. CB82 TaxID=3039159 RepID=UPI0024B1AF16|nr:anthranilate synthase component I family protein [Bradyrhizobium sp. CB82]WFU44604.1 anthranilate synthase component I family protein [Bradyrhizobium sp. CB82]
MNSIALPGRPSWRVQSETLTGCTPLQSYLALRERYGADGVYILESLAGPGRDVRVALVGFDKVAEITIRGSSLLVEGRDPFVGMFRAWAHSCVFIDCDASGLTIKPDRTWDVLKALRQEFAPPGTTDIGFLSFFSYDAAWLIEKLPRHIPAEETEVPDISLSLFRGTLTFDIVQGTAKVEYLENEADEPFSTQTLRDQIAAVVEPIDVPQAVPPSRVTDSMTKQKFEETVRDCLEHIAAGDIYQIQLGHEVRIQSAADPFDVYRRLRSINPSPYMYFAPVCGTLVIGASPELFIRKENNEASMRPIAGTKRRSGDDSTDAKIADALRQDEKERAEHVMLIDLCRNDLGRVCEPGTLVVDECMVVERYSHVLHLVSNVRAFLAPEEDVFSFIRATFPAGTMTGAPKIRAMELIESFESTRRSFYAGAGGLITLSGDGVLALCIRTALFRRGEYFIRASAGVVADSQPESEWQETLSKLAGTFVAITGADFPKNYTGEPAR